MALVSDALMETLRRVEPAETIDQSLSKVLKAQAEEKRRVYQGLARYYQARFGMSPEEFYRLRIEGRDHSWEDEETYFDWVTALQMIEEMEEVEEVLKREGLI